MTEENTKTVEPPTDPEAVVGHVREYYGEIARSGGRQGCCGSSPCNTSKDMGYRSEDLEAVFDWITESGH